MISEPVLEALRAICLRFPETREDAEGVGSSSFKVREKIFAMHHGHEGRSSLWCKAPQGMQATLVADQPGRFFVPPYVGRHGWVGVWLDGTPDWNFVHEMVEESYRMTAPKRLLAPCRDLDARQISRARPDRYG